MTDPTLSPEQKKTFPTWAKVLIVFVILGVLFLTIVGVGFKLVGDYLAGGGGKQLIEKGIEKAIEVGLEHSDKNGKNPNIDFNLGEKGIVVKDQDSGEEFSIKADSGIPADFPKDIPIYSPSKIMGSMVMGPMNILTLQSEASSADVFTFYQNQMGESGWATQMSTNMGDGSYTGIFQKDSRQITISVTAEGPEETTIALSHAAMPQ